MKKILLISTFTLLLVLLTTGMASARVHFGFGLVLPPVVIGPPVVTAPPPAYYPYPYPYYGPGYYGYYGYRTWVPGDWGSVRLYRGWGRVWHPGHWRYQR
jgi:hypothetical protein